MSTFKTFIDSKQITSDALTGVSSAIEHWGNEGRALLNARTKKRRTQADKKYDELKLTKPAAGRGVSAQQVEASIAGKSQPRKVRSKLFRAVNAVLQQKKQAPIADFKLLFEGSEMKKGKKPKEKTAAPGAAKS